MNKMIKLPLFLGICGASCAGVLSLINLLTEPIIQENEEKAANDSIYNMFKDYSNIVLTKDLPISDDLAAIGVSSIIKVEADGLSNGMVYQCLTHGYNNHEIKFQVAYANGKYLTYNDVYSIETEGIGSVVIANMPELLKGKDPNSNIDTVAGATFTSKALKQALEAISKDYMEGIN